MTTPKKVSRRTRSPRCPTPANATPGATSGKAYIGGYVDVELKQRVVAAAKTETDGNETLMMKKFLRAGLDAWEASKAKAA